MSARDEAVALRWVAQHVQLLECRDCGGRWIAKKSGVLFHQCQPAPRPRYRRRPSSYSPLVDIEETRREWAASLLGAALEESIVDKYGDDALLREVD